MKIKLLFSLCFYAFLQTFSFSQLTATWALTANKSGVAAGTQAATVIAGDVIPGGHFAATATHNTDGLRCTQNIGNWPTAPTDSFQVDFPFSPNGSYDVTISGVTLTAKTSGSSGANVLSLAVQTNGSGAFVPFGSSQNAISGGSSNINFGALSQVLTAGNTYIIRMYIYAAGSSTTKSRSIYLKNVVFSATSVLPLRLLSFEAKKSKERKDVVALNWSTDNEINTANFEIEKSSDGIHFIKTGSIIANNRAGVHYYSFTHSLSTDEITNKIIYYRLVMIDKDGKSSLSKILKVSMVSREDILFYPNPSRNSITIFGTGENLAISNMLGLKLIQQKTTNGYQKINISSLKQGIYFILLNDINVGKLIVE